MKLQALLARLPEKTMDFYRQQLGMRDWADDKCAEQLAQALLSKEELFRLLLRMKPWTAGVLKAALCRFGPLPFEQSDLERAALEHSYSGAHAKAALAWLRKAGVVFGLRKSWGEEVYLLPEDSIPVWQALLLPGGLQELPASVSEYGEPFGNRGVAAYDTLVLLDLIAKNAVKATRQGAMAKQAVRKLESRLIAQNEDLMFADIRMSTPGVYGPASAIVLDMALRSGLIASDGELWTVCGDILENWMNRPLAIAQRELYQIWRIASGPAEVWTLHALSLLEQAIAGKWYMLDHLFDWLRDCGMINRIDGNEMETFVKVYLLPMQAFGWIQLLEHQDGGISFRLVYPLSGRLAPGQEPYNGLIVQPDLELILPPFPPLRLLWEIMSMSEPVSSGQFFVFRLTKESIRHAVERGTTADAIMSVLIRGSRLPIPEGAANSIKEWAGRHQAVLLSDVTLLRLEDPVARSHLEAHEGCRGCIVEKIGESTYIVSHEAVSRLAGELGRLGISLLKPGSNSVSSSKSEEMSTPLSFLIPRLQDPVFAPSPLSDEEDITAEWRTVPAVWWRELRQYHLSTQKDMVRKAIDWQAPVKLTDAEGEGWEIIPLSIQESQDNWCFEGIRGRERIRIHGGEWEKMKLILPGLSD